MSTSTINLSDLNGTNGFTINGIDASDYSGRSVSSAGDVNGDGIDDLIIGAAYADPYGNSEAGESYVVYGSDTRSAAALDLSDLNGTNGFQINGTDEYDYSGYSVSSAGDVNGDGIDDLIIGAYGASPDGKSGAGESYVVYGVAGADVSSKRSFDLGLHSSSENLTLTGSDNIKGLGNDNDNVILGNSGANTLSGKDGDDKLHGNSGNDKLYGKDDDDRLYGGTGDDKLYGGKNDDFLRGDTGNDTLSGSSGKDRLYGKDDDDKLYGGSGKDELYGGKDDDKLDGGSSGDLLQGGTGKDIMTGGTGADTFVFKKTSESKASASRADIIEDFKDGVDKINLKAIDASTELSGNNKFTFDDTKSFGESKKGDIYYKQFDKSGKKNDYTMIYIDTDDDRDAEMSIRLTGLYDLSADDFIL